MGSNQSKTIARRGTKRTQRQPPSSAPSLILPPNPGLPPSRRIPDIRFRVLVIGRANAGKTTILQRVCDTTESPTIYRGGKEVSYPNFCPASDLTVTVDQFKLEPSMNVSDTRTSLRLPL